MRKVRVNSTFTQSRTTPQQTNSRCKQAIRVDSERLSFTCSNSRLSVVNEAYR